jgi:excisionase family DNA binding protein
LTRLSVDIPSELVEQIATRAAELVLERQAQDGSPWLDADGAARYLSTSRERIYDLVQLRKLTTHRDGRRLLFRRAELDRYLKAAA